MKRYYPYLIPFLALLPSFLLRDYTPNNELRYLSIADEAIRNGDIFTFTNHGLDYADKPPLYFWIIMLGRILFGQHVMAFIGMFSVIPALVVVGVMNRWVRDAAPREDVVSGSWMMISCGLFLGAAAIIRMDMLMCMFIVLALRSFYILYMSEGKCGRHRILFPVFIFLAVFTKGPIGFLMPLVATLSFLVVKGKWKTIGRYWGFPTLGILFGLCALWFTGVYMEGGREYLDNLLFNQTVNRAVDSFHHKEPFYYYMVSVWYSLAPWSPLIIGVIIFGLFRGFVKTDLEKFFLTAAASAFIMLSAVSSKIQIYLLPAFPFFCYLAVIWIDKVRDRKWMRFLTAFPGAVFTLVFPVFLFTNLKAVSPFLWAAACLLTLSGLLSFVKVCRGKINKSIDIMAAGLFAAIFIASLALPKFNHMIGYRELGKVVEEESANLGGAQFYSYRVIRPENIDVYIGYSPLKIQEGELVDHAPFFERPAVFIFRKRDMARDSDLAVFLMGRTINFVHDTGYTIIE